MGEVFTRMSTEIIDYFEKIEQISNLVDILTSNYVPSLNGEYYLTDTELAAKLKLTKRTLLEYRNNGKIPYYQIGGKILYRESDIVKLLTRNRKEAFRQ